MTILPKEIQASRSKGTLTIIWQDGHQSDYRLVDLRAACPCAECQGTHGESGAVTSGDSLDLNLPLRSESATKLESLEQVGNYALQITWQDGHSFGIYTWEYLRSLSPSGEHVHPGEEDG